MAQGSSGSSLASDASRAHALGLRSPDSRVTEAGGRAPRAREAGGSAGREAELSKLAEAYRVAQQGDAPHLVMLEGPGGIGKSAILAELRSRLRLEGGVVLEGRCQPGRAFGPFAEIVDRAMRFLEEVGVAPTSDLAGLGCGSGCHPLWHQHASDGDLDAHARDAEGAEPEAQTLELQGASPDIAAFERRLRFFDAVAALLREVAHVRAPVVVLHNLERADRGTLELLSFLLDATGVLVTGASDVASRPGTSTFALPPNPAAGSEGLRALLVCSLRSDGPGGDPGAGLAALRAHDQCVRISVGALDADGVRAFLQSEDTIARVLERTGGNPELIERLLEADPLTPAARVERRLSRLSADGRALVQALAVLGRPAAIESLAPLAELSVEAAARSDFAQCDLLVRAIARGEIVWSFERETDRETSYALIAPASRREFHARAVDLAAEQLRPEEAVRHALLTGDHARATDLALMAAASLTARHAQAEAASLLESLLDATQGDVPLSIREELADLYRVAGDYRAALRHATAVAEVRNDEPAAHRRVGYLLTVAGELDAAAEPLHRARELAKKAGAEAELAETEALIAELGYQKGDYAGAREWATRALDHAVDAGALRIEISSRNTLGKLALAQKDPAAAAELFEQNRHKAASCGLGHQEAQACTNLGVAMLLRRDLEAAESACRRAIEVATRASDTRDRAIATENLAVLAHLSRDYRRALTHYHLAVGLLKRLGNRPFLARVANNLGELYLSLGDRDRARSLSDLAGHVGGTGEPPSLAAQRLRLRGRIEAAFGNGVGAARAFESALVTSRALGDARGAADVQLEMTRLALVDGDVARARELLAGLPAEETPRRAAEVAQVAAEIERAAGGDTLGASRRALEMAERSADDELLLPALVAHARALVDVGDHTHAARLLERAHSVDVALTEHVPDEARDVWAARPVRAELLDVQARLASASTARDSTAPRAQGRRGSIPPAPRDLEQRAAQWRRRYPAIAGNSHAIASVLGVIDKVATSDAIVLVRGESGTGKELVADAVHNNSPRAGKPLVKVNCAALVETLLLSELFGHERGAFTGAASRKKGRFELADGGTIFLDEIGDISAKTQVALLRVLQEKEFERVGGTAPIRVDVRIIAATHRNLEQMVREGSFREDLYYRLRGVTVEMPPLRKRLEDLPLLAERLLERIAEERQESEPLAISSEALALLASHRWSGNVRELENVLRSATLFAETDTLVPEDFAAFADTFVDPAAEAGATSAGAATAPPAGTETGAAETRAADEDLETLIYDRVRGGSASLFEMKKQLERECIVRALEETSGNITKAASLLGMKRPRLSQLVKEYDLGELGK